MRPDASGHRPAPINEAWLALASEEVIDPDLPIVDPHHHLWNRETQRYLMDELRADIGCGHDVRATVFVDCVSQYFDKGPERFRPVGETEFVAAEAGYVANGVGNACNLMAGIVGHADLCLGDRVDEVLERHIAAGKGRFRGIRHATQVDPRGELTGPRPGQPGLLGDLAFRAGFSRLARFGLSFDAWLFHPQIGELTALARAFPDTSIVVDHVGGVLGAGSYQSEREEVFAAWSRDMRDLAQCGNVSVKLGGLGMPLSGFGFNSRPSPPSSDELAMAWRPYIQSSMEWFGSGRGMFESNFPVDKQSCSYRTLWNTFKKLASGASASEREALFSATACRIYRVAVPA